MEHARVSLLQYPFFCRYAFVLDLHQLLAETLRAVICATPFSSKSVCMRVSRLLSFDFRHCKPPSRSFLPVTPSALYRSVFHLFAPCRC